MLADAAGPTRHRSDGLIIACLRRPVEANAHAKLAKPIDFDLCRCVQRWFSGDAKHRRPAIFHVRCRAAGTPLVEAPGRLLSASSRCSINVGISTGLVRKQTAPAFNA